MLVTNRIFPLYPPLLNCVLPPLNLRLNRSVFATIGSGRAVIVTASAECAADPLPTFMTAFNDLPLELLPAIVQNVVKPSSLASFCLVNKAFCEFTRPFLYHTVALFWNNKEKVIRHNLKSCRAYLTDLARKIIRLFRTLSSSPELAKHVRKLGDVVCLVHPWVGRWNLRPVGNQKSGIFPRG